VRPSAAPAALVISVAIASATAGVLPVFLTGALAVSLRRHLHLDATALGLGVATFFATSALCSARAGAMAERRGPLPIMQGAALAAVVSLAAVPLVATDAGLLAACLAVGGIANGAMQPAVNLLLATAVPGGRQGLAFGVKQAGIPTATLLSGLAVPGIAVTAGWQAAYLAAAALAVVVLAVLGGYRRRHPGDRTPTPPVGSEPVRATGPRRRRRRPTPAPAAADLDRRPLVVLAVAMAAAVAAANALGAFVVSSGVAHGLSESTAGFLSAAGSIAGLSARVSFGWHADRDPERGGAGIALRRVTLLVAAGVVGYLLLATGSSAAIVPGVLVAYGAGWGFNGLFNLAVVRANPHAPARATGITQIGTYAGGMVGPLLFGTLVDRAGYTAAWLVTAGLAALGAAAFAAGRSLLDAPAPTSVAAEPGTTRA
jgi:MFS family permease